MKVIPPVTVTDAMLISSTAPEPGAGETIWVSGTTYAKDDVRIRTTTHRKYKRLIAGAGTTPPESDAVNWLDVGPTNKWAMFDLYRNTATELASPLTVVIAPGTRISDVGIVGLQSDAVTISVDVGVTNYYSESFVTTRRRSFGWSDFLFAGFAYQAALAKFGLPPMTSATITITITGTSIVKCGGVVLGRAADVGRVQYSPTRSALNFSKIERDAFGNATLVPRRTVPQTNQKTVIDKAATNTVLQLASDLNAVPALWSGLDDQSNSDYFDALLILGVYKEFTVSLDHPTNAVVTVQLEEI